MIKTMIFATFLLLTLLLTTKATAEDYSFIGKAYDLDSNELLYTEHHTYTSPTIHKVEYKEPNGNVFATKIINYENSFFSPNFILKNNKNGETINVKKEDEKFILKYRESNKSSINTNIVEDSSTLVIDAGFDNFIKRKWKTLISGKSISVNYLIPSQGDSYKLILKKVNCDNPNNYCFSISASSFFIRIFSSELKLTYSQYSNQYSQSTKNNNYRLTSFKGRTNISDSKGNYQDAHIRYQFPF